MASYTSTNGGMVAFPVEAIWPAELRVVAGPVGGIEVLPDDRLRVVYETREQMTAALREMAALELAELEARLERGLEMLAGPRSDGHWERLLERYKELVTRHEVVRQVGESLQ
jgi:hypothetical protein